jgi:hypothetical protein
VNGGRKAVFARELVALGPWRTAAALKRAHRRGVLVQGIHWDWLGGQRVYYPDKIFPGLTQSNGKDGNGETAAQAIEERLLRVLAQCPPRKAASRLARRPATPRHLEHGQARHPGSAGVGEPGAEARG